MRQIDDFIFSLDLFQGPLDYLLYLIQKEEIDISDVTLQSITSQLIANMEKLDVDSEAEFIGTTATLMLLKSRKLLPKSDEQSSEEDLLDPRFEIIHQLVEYCRIKEIAKNLSELEAEHAGYFEKGIQEAIVPKKSLGIEHLTVEELRILFNNALEKSKVNKQIITEDFWKVSDKIAYIRTELMQGQKRIELSFLFSSTKSREELIVTFLALLELMKMGEAKVIRENEEITIQPQESNNE